MLFFACVLPRPAAGGAAPLLLASLDESTYFAEIPSVYSASRYSQKAHEAPSAVTVVSADEIRRLGHRSLAQILQGVRGFLVTDDRNYASLNVRGFGLPSDYNNRVLVLLDGVRLNENVYDSPGVGLHLPVDTDMIDRVEIVRGPGSSIHGSSAFFAVINVITRKGVSMGGGAVSLDAGSQRRFGGQISGGGKSAGGIDFLVSAGRETHEGDRRLYFAEFDDPASNYGVAENIDGENLSRFFAKLTTERLTFTAAVLSRDKEIPTASYGTIFNDAGSATTDRTLLLAGQYHQMFDSGAALDARLSYNNYRYHGEYPYRGDPLAGEALRVENRDSSEGRRLSGDVQLAAGAGGHRLSGGLGFTIDFRQEQQNFYVGADDWGGLDDRQSAFLWHLFVQDEMPLTDTLRLTSGLRLDHHDSFGAATSPRLALIYLPRPETSVKILYGRAFRAPNVYERFYSDGGITTRANPSLDPETIDTWELVAEQVVNDNASLSAGVFRYDIDNLIRQAVDPDDIGATGEPVFVFRNLGRVRAQGFELEARGQWRQYKGRLSYTYQENRDRDSGLILSNSPRSLAKAALSLPLGHDLFLGLEEQYVSRRRSLFSEKNPGETERFAAAAWITNLTLTADKVWRNVNISLGIQNLFDTRYGDPGAAEHRQDIIDRDGRGWRFKMDVPF